jgi:hypothetical protein
VALVFKFIDVSGCEIVSGSSGERVFPAIEPVYHEESSTADGPTPSASNVTLDANSANRAVWFREHQLFSGQLPNSVARSTPGISLAENEIRQPSCRSANKRDSNPHA